MDEQGEKTANVHFHPICRVRLQEKEKAFEKATNEYKGQSTSTGSKWAQG